MSENDLTDEQQESSAGLSAGAMLREAREAAKLSVEEVASELHLVSNVVVALENGDRSKLPSRVFTLGYLKNYAKLVNIPYEQVKTAFDDFTDDQVPVLNQPRAPQIPEQSRGGGWFIKALGWMILIAFLFGLALEELAALEEGEEPYLLTVLTIGTHHPDGHVADSCAPLPDSDDSMLQAIYCSDQLISGFIDRVSEMTDPDETLIVVFSDHLAMRNTLWDTLSSRL